MEPGAVVNSSIVWESRGQRTLFGRRGVRGLANVDVTAELAVRLAAAYGTSLKKGSVVCCSRDTSRVARTLKRAVMSGLNLSGVHVEDLELAPVPLTRFHVRSERAQGGVTVRLSPDDPASVEIRFFDAQGGDIDDGAKRKIERLLARDDFRRAFAGDIGDIVFPPRVLEYYTAALVRSISTEAVREARLQARARHLVRVGVGGAEPGAGQARRRGAGREPVRRHRRPPPTPERTSTPAWPGSRRWSARRAAHLGVVFDPDGETLRIVDDSGHALTDEECLLALITPGDRGPPGRPAGAAGGVSREAERIAAANGATIAWAKLSAAHLMEVARQRRDRLRRHRRRRVPVARLPPRRRRRGHDGQDPRPAGPHRPARCRRSWPACPRVHVAHETVSTPWERKGTVMRTTLEQAQDRELVLVDGIKVLHADGWALVLPDPEEPLTHVWAEGGSEGGARALAQEYVGRIRAALVAEPEPLRLGPTAPPSGPIRAPLAAVLALVGFLTLVASSGVKEAKRGAESRRAGLVKLIHTRQGEVESLSQELVQLREDVATARRRLSADLGRGRPPPAGRADVGRDHGPWPDPGWRSACRTATGRRRPTPTGSPWRSTTSTSSWS